MSYGTSHQTRSHKLRRKLRVFLSALPLGKAFGQLLLTHAMLRAKPAMIHASCDLLMARSLSPTRDVRNDT